MAKTKHPYDSKDFDTEHSPSHIAFSTGNCKMGPVASISQEPIRTCPKDAPCAKEKKCYVLKNMIKRRPQIGVSYHRNTDLYYELGSEQYGDEIIGMIKLYKWVRFRWQVGGDMIDDDYAKMMIRVAKECPDTEFFAFTKKYDIAARMGELPDNLSMVLSIWGDYGPDDETRSMFPLSFVRDKDGLFEIPEDAFDCNDDCTRCMRCFHLQKGQFIVFDEH